MRTLRLWLTDRPAGADQSQRGEGVLHAMQRPCSAPGPTSSFLSATQFTGKHENQQDKQDEPKDTSAYQRSSQIKTAAAEQEH